MEEQDYKWNVAKDKYHNILDQYTTKVDDEKVATQVANLLSRCAAENDTAEVKRLIYSCIDLTTLKTTDSEESVLAFTESVNAHEANHPDLPHVAAICVYPCFAHIVSESLEVEDIEIACVAGGFPSSQTFTEVKIAETAMALHDGATEIDIVLPVGKFLSGDYEGICDEIGEIKALCGEKKLKVILETGALGGLTNVKKAAVLAIYAGADFIKTSTGKMEPAATPEAVYAMCEVIRDYYAKTGEKIGIKPAGGINTVADAIQYYTIVKEVLGAEWLNSKLFRLGASRLARQIY